MPWSELLTLLHVATAIGLICGLLGRWVTLAAAARSRDIGQVSALLTVASIFELRFVRPASVVVLISGLLLTWVQQQPLLGFFQGASGNWLLVSLLLYLSGIPLVALIFVPRGRQFAAAYAEAEAQGVVTPRLTSAFHDRGVYLAHIGELIAVFAVLGLMVTKAI
jgi:uncharacterized membrane protein